MIPGMGADERLFAPQLADGLPIEVAPMITPERGDDMARYAERIRDAVDLTGNYAVGGISYGGMVACELAQLCAPKFVLLIASCREGRSLPGYYRLVEYTSRLLPTPLIQRRCAASSRVLASVEKLDREQYDLIRDMSLNMPVPFLRRVGRMIIQWEGPRDYSCPVRHIHGSKDRVIPFSRVTPDEVVPEGGHLINMTHTNQVNRYIERVLTESATAVSV